MAERHLHNRIKRVGAPEGWRRCTPMDRQGVIGRDHTRGSAAAHARSGDYHLDTSSSRVPGQTAPTSSGVRWADRASISKVHFHRVRKSAAFLHHGKVRGAFPLLMLTDGFHRYVLIVFFVWFGFQSHRRVTWNTSARMATHRKAVGIRRHLARVWRPPSPPAPSRLPRQQNRQRGIPNAAVYAVALSIQVEKIPARKSPPMPVALFLRFSTIGSQP